MTDQDQQTGRGVLKGRVWATDPLGTRARGMKGLLVLCLGLLVLADANRSPLQQRALELVLDFFHSRDLVQATFKEQAVTHVTETEFPRGTYVQLEVDLVQTLCRKQQRGMQNCRIKPGGRKQKCLACFKFNSSDPHNILDESKRCLSEQNPIFQEVRRKQNQECEAVKEAYEEQRYHIGQFAFLKGLPEE
ncbi:retinoic acid receptor responder protein 2 [Zootoca vivipara]|uniref:retinoic acid receptor responder protein 2 n=1 Tax=Zootoca vivipara TaxID=8524 RepID=UPI00293BFA8B|nr:retinoic acid receptor responder protein 2 [Zootoca vivipara]